MGRLQEPKVLPRGIVAIPPEPPLRGNLGMPSLHYLTVQDILWINLQVTKKVQHFNYARLEEAVFYQYAYGESNTLLPQAARFLAGFARLHPFEAGNEATAFVACDAFLRINGKMLNLDDPDALDWFEGVTGKGQTEGALEAISVDIPGFHPSSRPEVRPAVETIVGAYPQTLRSLFDPDARAAS